MINVKYAFEASFEISKNKTSPDKFASSNSARPPSDFVVSRLQDGSVASRYGDFIWDISAYSSRGKRSKLAFTFWGSGLPSTNQLEVCDELRWLMFLLIWKRQGDSLSTGTLQNYCGLLRALGVYADKHGIYVFEVFGQPGLLGSFLVRQGVNSLKLFLSLYQALFSMGEEGIGFSLLSKKELEEWVDRKRLLSSECRQTTPMPSRIYSTLISLLMRELSKYEEVLGPISDLATDCIDNPLLGMYSTNQREKAKRNGLEYDSSISYSSYSELLDQYGLDVYFEANEILKSRTGMIGLLGNLQMVCKVIILIYSGMRRDEVDYLPYSCLKEIRSGSKIHYRLIGTTTKLNNGHLRKTRWITSREGAAAVRAAKKIADLIYYKLGVSTPEKSDGPLFVSLNYLRRDAFNITNGIRASASRNIMDFSVFQNLVIQEEDLIELEQIDPYRAWRRESEYKVGMPWRFKSHQFRRSLALYASRSGLVSLPSLRRQLQHITEEMSRYYSSGSASAKNIIRNDSTHFGWEYQSTQPRSQALAYMANVLLSDERLFGAHGAWIENNIRRKQGGLTSEEREKTIKDFEKGLVAYKETNLGGCTEILPCNNKAMRSITACLECSRSVIKESNLDRLIASQEAMVRKLNPNSMEERTERGYLNDLIKYKEKISA